MILPRPTNAGQIILSRELTNLEKTRRLKFALAGDACNAIYLNLATAGSVLLLFMDRLGLDKAQIGVLLALLGFGPIIAPVTSQLGARLGFKKLSLLFNILRVILMTGMIAAPWIAAKHGPLAAFNYVAAVMIAFSLTRSTADSMGGPWSAEFVPPGIRGRFTAQQVIVSTLCGAGTILTIGHFLGHDAPIGQFQIFFTVAILFGLLHPFFYSNVPGGAAQGDSKITLGNMLVPLKDRVYRRHLLGHMVVNCGWFATMSFAPLYLKEQVGLPPDKIVTLDAVNMIGSLVSSFMWGWAADRYGGKPVMVSLLSLHVLMPTGLLFMPRGEWSYPFAVSLYFIHGFVGIGWVIGFFRYFFINIVPRDNRAPYIALNTCMAGLMVGSSPLWAGFVLQKLSWLHGNWGLIPLNPHVPFFLGLIVCVIIATWLMAGLPSAGAVGARQFASYFFQGNPLATFTGLVGFRYAGREEKRVAIVERLGQSRSPLTTNELVEALEDPSFSVRYEAIVSSVRTVRDPSLTEALARLLKGADPGLQMAAVWALGRMGDPLALPQLRELLDAPYRTMRAQVARSLGMLHDQQSADRLMTMFRAETDVALRIAYGSAVASLGREDAIADLLKLLRDLSGESDEHRRREVALALATLVGGGDDVALRLWRRIHDEPGDTIAAVLLAMRQRLTHGAVSSFSPETMNDLVERCAYAFAAEDFETGIADLMTVIDATKTGTFSSRAAAVIKECRRAMASDTARREYALLATHAMHVGFSGPMT